MNIKTHYITRHKRSGIYYFRLDIPADLQYHFRIKTIKRSLRTNDRFQASILCLRVTSHFKSTFATLRGMPKFDPKNHMELVTVKANGKEATFDSGDPELDYEHGERFLDKHGVTPDSGHPIISKNVTSNSIAMSEVIEKYCGEMKLGNNWTDKTEGEYRSVYQLFLDIVGHSITTDMVDSALARSYKETLVKIPPNMNKVKAYDGLSIPQIIARNPTPISVNTINKQLTRISSLMKWAKIEGYIADNTFAERTIKTKGSVANERLPFTRDDIQRIFIGDKTHKHPYQKWVPLLGYYTGARLNELCQLYVDDIQLHDGYWHIIIIDSAEDQRLKGESSKRKTPIHKALKRLGFLDFVEQQKLKGKDRLFTDLKMTRDGYGGNASKWFSRHIKKQGVIHRKKSFHSLRHTFVEELKMARVHYKDIAGLVGHYDADITTNRYGSGEIPIAILDEAIQKLPSHSDDI
jgi:integrase